jgi:hypothetical protein
MLLFTDDRLHGFSADDPALRQLIILSPDVGKRRHIEPEKRNRPRNKTSIWKKYTKQFERLAQLYTLRYQNLEKRPVEADTHKNMFH